MTPHLTPHLSPHLSEEDLIAYQLGETPHSARMAAHLEHCAPCASTAESIAQTLRVFSADPAPEANLDHAWQRLRGSLPLLPASPARPTHRWRKPLAWTSTAALTACLLAVAVLRLPHRTAAHHPPNPATTAALQPGPLTAYPRDQDIAAHLGNAERLLTEIDHAAGPLDQATRDRAAQLLLTNALYVQRAQRDGDTAQASVLEQLGRTLTSVEHQPANPPKRWNLRLEMNTSGLLLDIRILQQNDAEPTSPEPALSEPTIKERP